MMGLIEYEMRLPLCKLTQNSYDKLKKAMADYGLLS
jgi:dihydrodipicolinate synthase/N-acetylneuraminate lyase